MSEILLLDVPESLLDRLRVRARHHQRSVEGEVLTILEDVFAVEERLDRLIVARAVHNRLVASGRTFSDSVELFREDRAR